MSVTKFISSTLYRSTGRSILVIWCIPCEKVVGYSPYVWIAEMLRSVHENHCERGKATGAG